MKIRSFVVALAVGFVATAAFAVRARATSSAESCGPWEICFCRGLGCNQGAQLCASGAGFTCYQDGVAEQ